MADPDHLHALAQFQLPPKTFSKTAETPLELILAGFSSKGSAGSRSTSNYIFFYIDHTDAIVVATRSSILRIRANDTGPTPVLEVVQEIELGHLMDPSDMIQTALPDFRGRLWWSTDQGLLGTVDLVVGSSSARLVPTGYAPVERQYNAFSTDEDGRVYVTTNRAVYAFATFRNSDGSEGEKLVWRDEYPNDKGSSFSKGDGSGTSAKLFGDGAKLLAIMDNQRTQHVRVYLRGDDEEVSEHSRLVCTIPVLSSLEHFRTETSFVGYRNSLIITNNVGLSPLGLPFPRPGVARVDVDPVEKKCKVVWENHQIVSVAGALKMSPQTGLIYVNSVEWTGFLFQEQVFVAGLDFETGALVRKLKIGTGHGFFPTWATPAFTLTGELISGSLLGLHKFSPSNATIHE
eukprot:TRINITY_DN1951_c0_g1_i2.p1 TRINITY_DN1951_c0_g1~~TRINITY_DN1951_c0_g1_i2.p1  ORF type:complete len:403 (-),score=79.77 TRINITY_DN1951_c0_g1_i2:28-1236(-)